MRLFTAIPLPEEKKKLVTEITHGRLPISYVNITNLHITLNFLGEIDESKTTIAKDIFRKQQHEKINIKFDKLVKFRNQIHITVKLNNSLVSLQKYLESKFKEVGFEFQERPYYPHVKLANLHMDKIMFKDRKIENFPNEELTKLNFMGDKVILFESELLQHHAKHIPLMELQLV